MTFQIFDYLGYSLWNPGESTIWCLEKVKVCNSLPIVDDCPLSWEIAVSELLQGQARKCQYAMSEE